MSGRKAKDIDIIELLEEIKSKVKEIEDHLENDNRHHMLRDEPYASLYDLDVIGISVSREIKRVIQGYRPNGVTPRNKDKAKEVILKAFEDGQILFVPSHKPSEESFVDEDGFRFGGTVEQAPLILIEEKWGGLGRKIYTIKKNPRDLQEIFRLSRLIAPPGERDLWTKDRAGRVIVHRSVVLKINKMLSTRYRDDLSFWVLDESKAHYRSHREFIVEGETSAS